MNNATFIGNLEARIPTYVDDLRELCSEYRLLRRDLPESETLRVIYDLAVYCGNAVLETSSFALALVRNPEQNIVWERYLALQLHEGITALPRLLGRLDRETNRQDVRSSSFIDFDELKAARVEYGKAMKPVVKDSNFMRHIMDVRNTVAAHHLGGKESNAQSLVQWVLGSERPDGDDLLTRAMRFTLAATTVGLRSYRAIDVSALPELPANPEEYYEAVRRQSRSKGRTDDPAD